MEAELEDESSAEFETLWSDHHKCKWPKGVDHGTTAHAELFAKMNEPMLSQLVSMLPPRLRAGRAPPPTRLDKSQTYQLYGEVGVATHCTHVLPSYQAMLALVVLPRQNAVAHSAHHGLRP